MRTANTITSHATGYARPLPVLVLLVSLIGFSACTSTRSTGSGETGSQKRVQLSVGDIKEITVPRRGDSSLQLIGSSDNQEVVDVSRRELAPAVDTLKQQPAAGPAVFQLKGITVGTANVTFSEKRPDEVGNGKTTRTYIVRVTAN